MNKGVILGIVFIIAMTGFAIAGDTINVSSPIQSITTFFSGNLTAFLQLSDTPNQYTGNASKCLKVNSGETALEFGDCGASNVININGTNNASYGEMHNFEENGFITVAIASADTWYNVTNLTEGASFQVNFANDALVPQESGWYSVDYSISFGGGGSDEYLTTILEDGVELTDCTSQRKLGTSGDVGNAGGTCIEFLDANDIITLGINDITVAADATVFSANVNIKKLEIDSQGVDGGNVTFNDVDVNGQIVTDKITSNCIEQYYEFEFTDNAALPLAGAYPTLEGGINLNANFGKYIPFNSTIHEWTFSSRVQPVCTGYPIVQLRINDTEISDISLSAFNQFNISTTGLPYNVSKGDNLHLYVEQNTCTTLPDDVIWQVKLTRRCD